MQPPVELTNIPQTFDRVVAMHPDKPAAWYLGTPFTYGRLKEMADRLAGGLIKKGIQPGDRVMVYLPNCVQWLVAWLGIQKAGAVAVPITPIYTPYDVAYIAGDTEAKAIVCTDRNYGYVKRVMKEHPFEVVVVSGMADVLPGFKRFFGWAFDKVPKGRASKESHTTWLVDLIKQSSPAQTVERDPDDIAEIIYTGGTTKHPKGVPITHRLLLKCAHEQISTSAALFDIRENMVMGAAPLFHILGQTTGLGTVLAHGGSMVLQPKVNLDAMMDAVTRHKATTFVGVPALYRMILEHDRLELYDLSSLKYCFCGGDVLPQDVATRWKEHFGWPIYIGYGASETVGGVCMCPADRDNPAGAMGLVLPSKDVRIVDPLDMSSVPGGESGELLVHSDPMVSAYWNKPEETAESFVEIDGKRYYRTADVVRRDEGGYLHFVDRTVDTIKHKGYRVSASEVECVLQDHHAVVASCVVGIPDEKVGERIKAFVVLKKDIKGITGYDLLSFCRGRLAGYKIPQYIEFRDMLPKSKVGKLLRREVRGEEASRREG
ncbi:MAG: AMP-binding protein [Desulfarculaceae bacterium]|nr:AMP-binding protein [Desulfarculaceae bacterium]MCF8071591.1 AMP-binding protein [Desulfarculaceae bacterium]MCF8102406.1 AMP-binding protein [Desulfarculaceae bacterium]MCF8114870.1 AMP-binding protein [Desulfarculaceae bacterium]